MSEVLSTEEAMAAAVRGSCRLLVGVCRRVELDGFGRNELAQRSTARAHLRRALRWLVALEDHAGVVAAGAVADRVFEVRRRAMACGLLSAADVGELEREACS